MILNLSIRHETGGANRALAVDTEPGKGISQFGRPGNIDRNIMVSISEVAIEYLFAGLPDHVWKGPPGFQVPEPAPAQPRADQSWHRQAASDAVTPLVHAGSMVELDDGRVRAFWFAGTREGGPDVGIHTAVFDPATAQWSAERRILDRHQVAQAFGWQRFPALPTWQSAFYAARFNEFVIANNKSWDEAMLALYPAELLSTPTPIHPPTLTPTRTPSWPIFSTPAP